MKSWSESPRSLQQCPGPAPALPSGEQPHGNGKSPFLMGKSTISMAIFNSYVSSPEGISCHWTKQREAVPFRTDMFH